MFLELRSSVFWFGFRYSSEELLGFEEGFEWHYTVEYGDAEEIVKFLTE